jgi:hypothetical protein
MLPTLHYPVATLAIGLWASTGFCKADLGDTAQLQQTLNQLRAENQSLRLSLMESNRGEKQASKQLTQVNERLEALGKNLLDGGDDRLVQAAGDLQLANERIAQLESTVSKLTNCVSDYLRKAVVSDPESRLRVESSLRELDAVLGLRQKPRPDLRVGSLQQARIVSLDQESGMLVLNVGENQSARIGMTFQLSRGQQPYGKAILADVRKGVSGAFIEKLNHTADRPRPGDIAILETQASAQ